MLSHLLMRVTFSDHAEKVDVKVKARGLADSRRPNTRRPLYRKVVVTVKTPLMYMVAGLGVVAHTSLKGKLVAAVENLAHSQEGTRGIISGGGSDEQTA